MAQSGEWILRTVVPFDVDLIVASDALGATWHVATSYGVVAVRMPRMGPFVEAAKRHCIVAPDGFEGITPRMEKGGSWGDWTVRFGEAPASGQVSITALAFEATLNPANIAIQPGDLSRGYAKGVEPLLEQLTEWMTRFCMWAQLIVNQPLDLSDPAPAVISLPHRQTISWVATNETRSWIDSSPLPITITMPGKSPIDERLPDIATLQDIASLANAPGEPPSPVSFLGEARLAAQRGRYRLAINAVGTGLEALLTAVSGAATSTTATLGTLVKDPVIAVAGISLPKEIHKDFVTPRNDAVHRGVTPSRATVLGAIAMLDDLVRSHYPSYSCSATLDWAHRPQSADLLIVTPPRPQEASGQARPRQTDKRPSPDG